MAYMKTWRDKLPDFTLYFMVMGCGFLWQVNSFDQMQCRNCWLRLKLHWRNAVNPRREWALYSSKDGGIEYRETSSTRNGAWVLRGPWQKIA